MPTTVSGEQPIKDTPSLTESNGPQQTPDTSVNGEPQEKMPASRFFSKKLPPLKNSRTAKRKSRKNPLNTPKWRRGKQDGLDAETWKKRFVHAHLGVCPICQRPFTGQARRRAHLDHDHRTGRWRGVICSNCNLALGCVDDSVLTLKSMVQYLIKPRPWK